MTPTTTEVLKVTGDTEREVLDTHINVKMTKEMHTAFKQACYIDRVEMSEVIRNFITKFNSKKREV